MKDVTETGWPFHALGEVFDVIGGGTPSKRNAAFFDGPIPWASIRDMHSQELSETEHSITEAGLKGSSSKLIPAGEVIMASRVGLGKACILRQDTAINQDIRALIPLKRDKVDRRFCLYWLQSVENEIVAAGSGATVQGIKLPFIKGLRFPLPPLEEQRRIVAKLDQAFTAIDRARAHAEANLADAEALFEDTLNALFAGLADNGNVVTLTDAVHPDCKLSYGIVQPGDEVEGGLAVVRPVDLKQRIITLDGVKTIDPAHADGYARTKLVGGELLLCVRGSTGEISVASQELEGANVTRGIVPIRFETDKVDPEFAYFQMRSRYVRDQILAKTYGAALMQINIKDLRQLNFVVPPLDLQRKATIAAEKLFEHSQTMIEGYQAKLTDLADLRQSLLQRAFSGQL
jgi:type I restriction enzyme S subunit